jgi:hypothetical protein
LVEDDLKQIIFSGKVFGFAAKSELFSVGVAKEEEFGA